MSTAKTFDTLAISFSILHNVSRSVFLTEFLDTSTKLFCLIDLIDLLTFN